MKVKALMKRKPKAVKVSSMTNESYKELCEKKLNKEIKEIKKLYNDSMSEAWKYYVR